MAFYTNAPAADQFYLAFWQEWPNLKIYVFHSPQFPQICLFQTDHDPRNPSYIVSQAPLANTVADFWQMIWEQAWCIFLTFFSHLSNRMSFHRAAWWSWCWPSWATTAISSATDTGQRREASSTTSLRWDEEEQEQTMFNELPRVLSSACYKVIEMTNICQKCKSC